MVRSCIPRRCFICESEKGDTVFNYDLDVCGLGRIHYAIRCCEGCGLTLQDPVVAPEVIAQQYALYSNYTAFTPGDPPLISPARRMLETVERLGVAPGRVYDVGAATGAMLWWFRTRGWSVGGCDLSPKAIQQAAELNQVAIDLGTDEDNLPRQSELDLITFCHVIEHVYDPLSTLSRAHAALKEQGLLLIEVPCLTAPEINPPGLFMMEHLNYFDETSLENLLRRVGFEIVDQQITRDHWPYPVITVLARRTASRSSRALRNSFEKNRAFCRDYARVDQNSWQEVDRRLRSALGPEEPIYIWGAGLHTSSLMERTGIARHANVVAITDRDPQKHDRLLGTVRVIAPDEAIASDRRIVVSSFVSESEVAQGLLDRGVAPERVVRLYNKEAWGWA